MSLTLNPTLKSAQDGDIHNIIVEMQSFSPEDVFPMTAYEVTSKTDESLPKSIMLSDGTLFVAFKYGSGRLGVTYTDPDRTTWYPPIYVTTGPYNGEVIIGLDLVELVNGNIGILFTSNASSRNNIRSVVLTKTGTYVTSSSIMSRTPMTFIGGIDVIRLEDDTYRYVFADKYTTPTPSYCLTTATSSDFITWSAQTRIEPASIEDIDIVDNPTMRLDTVRNELFLFFEVYESYNTSGVPLINIFYQISYDNGVTWSDAVRATNNQSYGTTMQYPDLAYRGDGEMQFAYTKIQQAMYITTGVNGMAGDSGEYAHVQQMYFDPVTREIHVNTTQWTCGGKPNFGITELNSDTLNIQEAWDATSTPQIPSIILSEQIRGGYDNSTIYNGIYPLFSANYVCYLDTINGIVTEPYFCEFIEQIDGWYNDQTIHDWHIYNGKLYFVADSAWGNVASYRIGYYVSDFGQNNWQELYRNTHVDDCTFSPFRYHFQPEEGVFFSLTSYSGLGWVWVITMFDFSGKGIIKQWGAGTWGNPGDTVGRFGTPPNDYDMRYTYGWPNVDGQHPQDVFRMGDNLFVLFQQALGSQFRGVGVYNFKTEQMNYMLPPFPEAFDYCRIKHEPLLDSLVFYQSYSGGGVALYNLTTGIWSRFSDIEYPGILPVPTASLEHIFYDPIQNCFVVGVYQGHYCGSVNWIGIMPLEGKLGLIQSAPLTWNGTAWELGGETTVNADRTVSQASIEFSPIENDSSLYYVWHNYNGAGTTHVLEWNKVLEYFDLTPYITEEEITVRRTIQDSPSELSFTLSHGHLFDPFNVYSLLKPYVEKGRRIYLKIGELINGVSYLEDQGVYYISEVSLQYQKGTYPIISVSALDYKSILVDRDIIATAAYNDVPSDVFKEIAQVYGEIPGENIAAFTFPGESNWNIQFMDMTVYEMLFIIATRFRYVPRFSLSGILGVVEVGNATSDHTYTNYNALLNFSPDSSYSDFTNRVTVTGEEDFDTEVLHDEEKVATLNGTVGWWGPANHEFTIYYSEDKSRRVRYPRMVTIQKATGIGFRLAGTVTEKIDYIDPNDLYCIIKIHTPDLRPALYTAIMSYVLATFIPDGAMIGETIPIGRLVEGIILSVIAMILGSIVNYYYEIYGLPVGEIRRSLQGTANDVENQQYIGRINEKTIEGWHCHSVSDCYSVAEYELNIVKWQRNRVKASKIAHLQDEEGDTIQINHIMTNLPLKIFITDLNRKLKKGDDGYFIDDIEGWVL